MQRDKENTEDRQRDTETDKGTDSKVRVGYHFYETKFKMFFSFKHSSLFSRSEKFGAETFFGTGCHGPLFKWASHKEATDEWRWNEKVAEAFIVVG
jgi:hypothetical protein